MIPSIEAIIKTISDIAYIPDLKPDTELIKSSLIDSFDMISLISEINYNYGIELKVGDIDPLNFATPNAILDTLSRIEERKNK